MWSWLSAAAAATAAALLCACPAHSDSGLAGSTFSNELRTGYTRLFQNGVEQTSSSPLQPFVLVQRNPAADFLGRAPLLLQPQRQAAAAFGPSAPTFHVPRPRYEPEIDLIVRVCVMSLLVQVQSVVGRRQKEAERRARGGGQDQRRLCQEKRHETRIR